MVELVTELGFSKRRRELLRGLLWARTVLRSHGAQGLHWIDGSFVEAKPAPQDIDTLFWRLRNGALEFPTAAHQQLFRNQLKQMTDVDVVIADLYAGPQVGELLPRGVVSYWQSLFSHTRQHQWKGFLEMSVTMDDSDDRAALALLSTDDEEE